MADSAIYIQHSQSFRLTAQDFFVILQSRDRISSILVCQITNIFIYMQCNWLNKIQYYHFFIGSCITIIYSLAFMFSLR